MTDTAKPTPGPWHVVCTPGHNGIGEVRVYSSDMGLPIATVNSNWPGRTVDAAFIAEAGTVYHETNLTPRQLLEQRDELVEFITQLKNYCDEEVRKLDEYAEDVASRNTIESIQDDLNVMFIKCGKVGG